MAENGAVALFMRGELQIEYAQDEATRTLANAQRHRHGGAACAARGAGQHAGARDSAGRITDIAIDHGEFAHLDEAAIARVVALMQDEA